MPAFLWAQAADGQLFTNAHVIVGDGGQLEGVDVLVQNGQIVTVGENLQPVPGTAELIDLDGKTLMPTLIDAHAHLGYQSSTGWGAEFYSRENIIQNLKQYLYFGFGAVFSAGSDADALALSIQAEQAGSDSGVSGESGDGGDRDNHVASGNGGDNGTGVDGGAGSVNAVSNNSAAAQFLFAAGMAPPGQGPNNQFLVHTSQLEQEQGMTILRGLTSPQQAREQVREVAEKGIKFIKIWVDDRGGTQTKLAPDLYRAVINEANAMGVKVFVHQQSAEDMPDLLDAGVDGFLHGRLGDSFTAAIAQQTADAAAFIVPNLGLGELRREAIALDSFLAPVLHPSLRNRMGEAGGMRQAVVTPNPLQERELAEGFARLENAGVDIVLGTDAGAIPDHPFGYTGHRELEIFVRLGMSEMNALIAATGNAARHLGLNDQGLIAPGYQANLLILNANPLQNIRNTRAIHKVYLDGQEIDRGQLLAEIMQ